MRPFRAWRWLFGGFLVGLFLIFGFLIYLLFFFSPSAASGEAIEGVTTLRLVGEDELKITADYLRARAAAFERYERERPLIADPSKPLVE